MSGRIEIYLDIGRSTREILAPYLTRIEQTVSFYSYVAFKQLLETGPILEAHGVQVE